MSNVFDFDESNIEITDYTDLDNTVKTIIVTAVTDTLFLEMSGGTTGQVLSKQSDTDHDFIWADVINDIQRKTVSVNDEPYIGARVGDSYLEITFNLNQKKYIPLISSYDELKDKPIINQDLDSLLFTPVANTYYRHTGITDVFTYGKLYFYNGEQYSAIATKKELDDGLNTKQDNLTEPQLDAVNSGIDSAKVEQIETNKNDIAAINGKIPFAASSENKLVDTAAMQSFAMPITTKYGANLSLVFNSANGKLKAQLKDQDGNNIGSEQEVTIDLQSIENTINGILDLIPAAASSSNKLVDTDTMNSSISTSTANFIGTFENLTALKAYSGTVTNNDYANVMNSVVTNNGADFASKAELDAYPTTNITNFDYAWVINGNKFDLYRYDLINAVWDLRVEHTDKESITLNTAYNRYKASVIGSTVTWNFDFTVNATTFTARQWAAINSGISESLVASYNSHLINTNNPHSVTKSQVGLGSVANYAQTNTPTQGSNLYFTAGGAYTELLKKLDKTDSANKVYGTDGSGNQTTYDVNSFGQVDDVQVDGVSVVNNKVANIDLSGKADKVSGATNGDLASLDSSGNLTDSGKKASDFMPITKTITIALAQVAGYGNDIYTTAQYIRFVPTAEQATILADETIQVVKLDLTALGDNAPAPYVWIKRNTTVQVSGNIAYQFSCGGEQFWYDNYQTDIAIKNIGNAALVYVPALTTADITILNVSIPELYYTIGNKQDKLTFDNAPTAGSTNPVTSEGIKTAIDNAIVAVYKPKGKATVDTLNGLTKTALMNGYVYDMTDSGALTNYDGTTETVNAKDNVCFIWNNGNWKWDNFGKVVDLSGYVQKTTEIAGLQINNGISASNLFNQLFTVTEVIVEE